jgi:hypothetical protein
MHDEGPAPWLRRDPHAFVRSEGEFFRVIELPTVRVAVVQRVPGRAMAPGDVAAVMQQMAPLVRPELRTWGAVIDTRAVLGNNDPEFERASEGMRAMTLESFARSVVLVRTMVGKLQVQRISASEGRSVTVVDDPERAFELARGEDPPRA